MRMNKLPKKRAVTVSDLLHISDKNEAKQSVIETLEAACEESRRFKSILIIVQTHDDAYISYKAGFTNADIIYITEMAKFRALQEENDTGECDCEECGEQ